MNKEIDKILYQKVLEASNHIANISRQSSGDYVMCSSFFAETIEKYEKIQKRKRIINKILKGED